MRIDRSHFPWAICTLLATAVVTILYFAAQHEDPTEPFKFLGITISLPEFFREAAHRRNTVGAKPMGLMFGIVAFAIFIFASALGVRKKKRLWPIGSVQFWLKAHIWLTTFTIPLVLFHCGFRTGGPHTTTLFWLYSIVMVSGFWGIALQQFMPRLMKESLPREVVFEQIPNIRAKIMEEALTFRGQMSKQASTPAPAPVAVAGAILVGTSRYGLFLMSPRNGRVIDGIDLNTGFAQTPAAFGGRAYAMTNAGTFLGIAVAPPLPLKAATR